ncbi:MAG: virulence protein [Oscillospiraceae bacterium]|nr:virulence protein [Oscillospiraceae bacterium]
MRIQYQAGPERKKLAAAVAEQVGAKAAYAGAPTMAYIVGNYTVSREGALIGPDDPGMVEILAARGFEPSEEAYEDAPGQPDRLTIEVPIDGSFTPAKMANLEKLVASRAALLMKVLGADALPVEQTPNSLKFDWFPMDGNAEVYSQLASALVRVATEATRITAREKPVESEKFRMRTMLLRLGFIGPEFSQVLLREIKSKRKRTKNEAMPPCGRKEKRNRKRGAVRASLLREQ